MEEISVKQWAIALVLVALIAFGIGRISGIKSMQEEIAQIKKQENQTLQIQNNPSKVQPDKQLITVYVTGEVKNPDVYKLPEKSITKDAIEKAGGAKEDADLISINLAKRLSDGEEIIVPKKGEGKINPIEGGTVSTNNGKININTADATTLEKLPGIGEVKANSIIQYRKSYGPFKSIHDITKVSGIGEKTFEKIKELITVG